MMKNTLALGLLLLSVSFANAQVSSINSARVFRGFTDDAGAGFSSTNSYPGSIVLAETNVDGTPGGGTFANRDDWEFSANSGATSFRFTNDSFFTATMTLRVTLPTGSLITPRKEAGFLLDTVGGQGQFIVNTDAHEIVAFGGPLPFYSFNSTNGLTYNAGDSITLGMRYFLGSNGKRQIVYTANGISSPAQEFTNTEQGIIGNSTLGGYLQVPISTANASNGATATFSNIAIAPVPEPSAFAALGLGALALLRRRRK